MRRTTLLVIVLAAVAGAPITLPSSAHAQAKKAAPKPVDAAKIKKELESGDEARMLEALAEVEAAEQGGKPALPHIEKLLSSGSGLKVLVRAIEVLGGLEQQSSSKVIAPYVQHRTADVRRAACKALIKTRGPAAVTALRRALRSSDPSVRGTAASGLGSLGAKEALPDLFTALDLKVAEASAAIGQLCADKDCQKFWGRMGKLPFDVMTSGCDQILFRPTKDISDNLKLELIGILRELGTKDAGAFLSDVSERWPEDGSKKVKQALEAAVRASGTKISKEDD